VDHSGESDLVVKITTCFNEESKVSAISISDNGKGIKSEFLQKDENGIKKIFLENVTSKSSSVSGGGYGCYIAYEISRRCGWKLDAENLPGGGSNFIISINNNS
jgi:signal transduction histidine kinase